MVFFFPLPSPSRSGGKRKIEYQLDLSRLICVARLFLPGLYETQIVRLSGLFIRPAYSKKYVPWRWYLLRLSNARYGRQTGYFVQHFQARVRGKNTPGKKPTLGEQKSSMGFSRQPTQPTTSFGLSALPASQQKTMVFFKYSDHSPPIEHRRTNGDPREGERDEGAEGGEMLLLVVVIVPPLFD